MKKFFAFALPSAVALLISTHALAADITITAIYGSGNPNGGWTGSTAGDVQLGLRGKNTTTGATPSDGAGVYTFASGTPWNFDFSINSNTDGAGTSNLTAFTYSLSVDLDPTLATAFATFSPALFVDNSYGNNGTANGAGVAGTFATLGGGNNVMQNSYNIGFFPYFGDPNQPGTYDFILSATSPTGAPANSTSIRVVVTGGAVPDGGSTVALLGAAAGLLALVGRVRRQRT